MILTVSLLVSIIAIYSTCCGVEFVYYYIELAEFGDLKAVVRFKQDTGDPEVNITVEVSKI